jgi:4-amino-4-deoxy-L-arabinose transferase-like glycosyltransferase
MFDFSRYKISGAVILLLFASYLALYEGLGADSMQLWDESSYALNAQEMLERGNPIEVYLYGKPDLYNSKPPLAIWCMATSIHFLGLNEIGVRFPAASFGLCAVLVLFIIGYRVTRDPWIALCAPLVLLSSTGFIGKHIARTGDTDSILAFWILAQSICFFLYTQATDTRKQKIWLLLTALTLSFGCLTKGIAGLTALPGLFAWLLYARKGLTMFRSPAFYMGIALFILLVPGYYVLRNMLTPGYLQAVWNFEIGGRITQQEYLNPEYRPFYYFYQAMIFDGRLMGWIFWLPAALFIIIRSPQGVVKDLGLFFVFALGGVSFSLGLSDTKLFWYDAPLYPLIAGIIGISFALLLPRLGSFTIGIFLAIFCLPYVFVLANNMDTSNRSHFPEFLKMVRESGHQQDSIYIIHAEIVFPLDFYAKQDALKGYYSKLVLPGDSLLKKGTLLITEKYAREADINSKFIVDTLSTYYGCSLYKIVGYK